MNILLCSQIGKTNQYIEELTKAYQKNGHNVILSTQNFLYSTFLPDFVHIHWPEAIYRWNNDLSKTEKTINLIKKRVQFYVNANIPIVYTAHDIVSHQNFSEFDKEMFNIIISSAGIIVHHGKESIPLLKEYYPKSKEAEHVICPHGPYPYIKENPNTSRKYYGLPKDKYVFLNFGIQQEYKGGDFTSNVFKNASKVNAFLFTIGLRNFYKSKENKLFYFLGKINDRVISPYYSKVLSKFSKHKKTALREVPNSEIPKIMSSIDVLFLGHKRGLNSGLIALALTYQKPVIFPDIGNFKEQVKSWPWYETYDVSNIKSAQEAVKRMIKKIGNNRPGEVVFDNSDWLNKESWDNHVNIITEAVKASQGKEK